MEEKIEEDWTDAVDQEADMLNPTALSFVDQRVEEWRSNCELVASKGIDKVMFENATAIVWSVLKPWLTHQYGEKCPDFEFSCECCQRWKLAEELLAYNRIGTPMDLEKEIAELRTNLLWREAMLKRLKENENDEMAWMI